jgi:hypothetical protein
METAYIVTGTLTDEHTVTLDEALPLAQGKVRLSVELLPVDPSAKRTHAEVIAEIRERQRARGHQPRSREEIDAYIQAERDSWND